MNGALKNVQREGGIRICWNLATAIMSKNSDEVLSVAQQIMRFGDSSSRWVGVKGRIGGWSEMKVDRGAHAS